MYGEYMLFLECFVISALLLPAGCLPLKQASPVTVDDASAERVGSHRSRLRETPVWPDAFKAVLFQNRTSSLALVDLYYDWRAGKNLNLIRSQLGAHGTVWDIEHNNGTSFIFSRDQPLCKVLHFDVGILIPSWLENATLAGEEVTDTFICNVWTKADFISYYAEKESSNPVRWTFTGSGAEFHVLSWEPGKKLAAAMWQAPPYCFTGNNTMPIEQPLATGSLFRMPQVSAAVGQVQQEIHQLVKVS